MLKHYSFFCGVFLLKKSRRRDSKSLNSWLDKYGDQKEYINFLKKTYYENYLTNILSGLENDTGVDHFTIATNVKSASYLSKHGEQVGFSMPYLDVFEFPRNIGIFALKVSLDVDQEIDYADISDLLYHVRNPGEYVFCDSKKVGVGELLRGLLSQSMELAENWDQFIPQLKTYSIIDDGHSQEFDADLDKKLFGISHFLPIDSGSNTYSPSQKYYQRILEEKVINIFSNWKAIALFDSFTRISCSFPDTSRTWERDYFLIYIHCLFTKFQLYHFNSQFKNVLELNNLSVKLKKRFIEFANDYNLTYISYKFLPNVLYEAINVGLEVTKELGAMDLKIERLHQAYQERKTKHINSILIVISLLSIASVVTDLSQWLVLLGVPGGMIYSPAVASILFLALAVLTIRLTRKY